MNGENSQANGAVSRWVLSGEDATTFHRRAEQRVADDRLGRLAAVQDAERFELLDQSSDVLGGQLAVELARDLAGDLLQVALAVELLEDGVQQRGELQRLPVGSPDHAG